MRRNRRNKDDERTSSALCMNHCLNRDEKQNVKVSIEGHQMQVKCQKRSQQQAHERDRMWLQDEHLMDNEHDCVPAYCCHPCG